MCHSMELRWIRSSLAGTIRQHSFVLLAKTIAASSHLTYGRTYSNSNFKIAGILPSLSTWTHD